MITLWLIFLLILITACNKNENSISNDSISNGSMIEGIYRYYPLDIGNQWRYETRNWSDSPPPSGTTTYSYYSIEVTGDTILTDFYDVNRKYRILKKTSISGEFQEYIYHRIDSSSLQIYEFSTIERKVFSFKNKEPNTTKILGQTTEEISLKINTQPFGEKGITYAKEFGLVNSYSWVPYSSSVTTLTYAKIKGREYI